MPELVPGLSSVLRSPFTFLILGAISTSAAVVWTFAGKAWVRFHGWVYRDEEPRWFWWEVAVYYLAGAFLILIGLFLYAIHAF